MILSILPVLATVLNFVGRGTPRQDTTCARCKELERERNILRTERGYWKDLHRRAKEREESLRAELEETKAKLKQREQQLFGRSSERSKGDDTKDSARSSEAPEKKKRGQRPKLEGGKAPTGRRQHEHLPSVDEPRELPEEETVCPSCSFPFAKNGIEESEVVEIEVRAYRRRIKRARYRRTCECPEPPRSMVAPPPPMLIPKGGYGTSLWIEVLLDKYLFQRPTNRLLNMMRMTLDLDISQGTITGGLKRLAPLFVPLREAIVARNISESHWHADETRWIVLSASGDNQAGDYKWTLWVFRSETTVVYVITPNRSAEVPAAHFGNDAMGILSVDRASIYKANAFLSTRLLVLAFCWSHVRRDFIKVARSWAHLEAWALVWVERIAELYRLNRERLAVRDDQERWRAAQAKLEQALEHMKKQRDEELANPKLHLVCRKRLESLKRHWDGLTVFLDYPDVPMDNNEAERALRNPVVGRKNYSGSGAHWSAELTASLFTLFQTLLAWNINPRRWLTKYLDACAEHGGRAPPDAEAYLPWNLSEDERRMLGLPAPEETDTS